MILRLLLLLKTVQALPWTLKIEPYEEECFLIKPPKSSAPRLLSGDYELIDDGGTGIDAEPLLVYVMQASDEKIVWRSEPGKSNGQFQVFMMDAATDFWICLQNSSHAPDNPNQEAEHPDHKSRLIGFSYTVKDSFNKPTPYVFTDKDEWREKSQIMEDELKSLINHHEYMRVRESNHRTVVEQTFTSVLSWTLTELFFVVIVAIAQVLYMRSFVEKKRSY